MTDLELQKHYRVIVEEAGPDSLMELWDALSHVYTSESINRVLYELKEYAQDEDALWNCKDDLPADETEIIGDSGLDRAEKLERLTALRAAKKAAASRSGLRIVPVVVPISVR